MGFYSQQAADLSQWSGDREDTEWRKFRREFEAKLMPRWVQQKLNDVDAELEGERARRESAEAHEKTLRAQIAKEAKIQQDLKRERDSALTEVGELRTAVEERDKALQSQIAKQVETEQILKSECQNAVAEAATLKTMLQERDAALNEQASKQADTEQGLKTERDRALADVAKLKATVEGLSRTPPNADTRWAKEPTKRWLVPTAVGIALLAAVLGGTLVSLWPGKKSEAETKVAELTATVTKSDKARQDAEAKANQAAAALAKSEQARQAVEANAADAEKARQAAAARAAPAMATQAVEANVPPTVTGSLFTFNRDMDATGTADPSNAIWAAGSFDDCQQSCERSNTCNVFSYSKATRLCYKYSAADLVQRLNFDSGVRKSAVQSTAARTAVETTPQISDSSVQPRVTSSLFTRKINAAIIGVSPSLRWDISVDDCAQFCADDVSCKAYVYGKGDYPSDIIKGEGDRAVCAIFKSFPYHGYSNYYSYYNLVPSPHYDSWIRQ
jgi:hypothetical protein